LEKFAIPQLAEVILAFALVSGREMSAKKAVMRLAVDNNSRGCLSFHESI